MATSKIRTKRSLHSRILDFMLNPKLVTVLGFIAATSLIVTSLTACSPRAGQVTPRDVPELADCKFYVTYIEGSKVYVGRCGNDITTKSAAKGEVPTQTIYDPSGSLGGK